MLISIPELLCLQFFCNLITIVSWPFVTSFYNICLKRKTIRIILLLPTFDITALSFRLALFCFHANTISVVFYISEDPLSASFTHFLEKYYFSGPLQLTLTLWPKCFHISDQFSWLELFCVILSPVDSNCYQLNRAKGRKDITSKNRAQAFHMSFSHTPARVRNRIPQSEDIHT